MIADRPTNRTDWMWIYVMAMSETSSFYLLEITVVLLLLLLLSDIYVIRSIDFDFDYKSFESMHNWLNRLFDETKTPKQKKLRPFLAFASEIQIKLYGKSVDVELINDNATYALGLVWFGSVLSISETKAAKVMTNINESFWFL